MARKDDVAGRLQRAQKINQARNAKGWPASYLAEKSGYDEKTIRNLLAGEPVREATIANVCQALSINLDEIEEPSRSEVSAEIYGGYARRTHRDFEGWFYLYRPSFHEISKLYKTIVEIYWDASEDVLKFSEYYQLDNDAPGGARAHRGNIFVSAYTGLVHLLTTYQGSVRLVTVTRLRENEGVMRGSMQTQSARLMFFQPTVAPVALRKVRPGEKVEITEHIRQIEPTSDEWAFANDQLSLATNQIMKIAVL